MTENQFDDLLSVLKSIDGSIRKLGLNDANTELGAIELLASEIKKSREDVVNVLERIYFEIDSGKCH